MDAISAATDDLAVLLILPRERLVFSASTRAFRIAEGPEKKLNARYRGAVVINRAGQISEIDDINVLGYSGDGMLKRALSMVFGIRDITVQFSRARQMELDEFKERAAEFVRWDAETGDPLLQYSDSLEDVLARLNEAEVAARIFDIIGVPAPHDCLDIL